MPKSRLPETAALAGLAEDHPAGHRIPPHSPAQHQRVHAARGVMRVASEGAAWVVPPGRAIWMPAGRVHAIRCTTAVALRTVYMASPGSTVRTDCRVCAVGPLLREVVVRLAERPEACANPHLHALLFEELADTAELPLALPEPQDPRLRRMTQALADCPDDRRTVAAWARALGLSERNLIRRFAHETGMTVRAWRRQARLLAALEALAAGRPVTSVAAEVGYDSPSAFVAAFHASLGETPGRYAARARAVHAVGATPAPGGGARCAPA
jgi:AraC-like DNA-binding protein